MFVPEILTRTVSMAHCHDVGLAGQVDSTNNIAPPVICSVTNNTCPDSTTYDLCKARNITLYRLTNTTLDIYNALRHIGFPLYVGSFDFYSFMISLMCDKPFFDAVFFDSKLYRLWSMMWLPEDLPNIERLIKEAHSIQINNNRAAANIVVDIIRGAWLRCDITKYMWSLIKAGW